MSRLELQAATVRWANRSYAYQRGRAGRGHRPCPKRHRAELHKSRATSEEMLMKHQVHSGWPAPNAPSLSQWQRRRLCLKNIRSNASLDESSAQSLKTFRGYSCPQPRRPFAGRNYSSKELDNSSNGRIGCKGQSELAQRDVLAISRREEHAGDDGGSNSSQAPSDDDVRTSISILGSQATSSNQSARGTLPCAQGTRRFDLEAYLDDSPQVRLAIITADQLSNLLALEETIGWSIDYRASPVDARQFIFVFGEDDGSLEVVASHMAISERSDDEDGSGTPTPTHPSSKNNYTSPENNRREAPATADGVVGHITTADANPRAPIITNLERLKSHAVGGMRLLILLGAGGALGAFGLWVLLAYDVIPNLSIFLEHLCLFSLGFLVREAVLWALHFAIRKTAKLAATWVFHTVGRLTA
ncbi:hypothetical protein DFP72DRAFT_843025 [Ephemerocybe angulata]|uniref:Uncharacterized protein n=1 Tax=Ephemerocybe angulata TaxID=980116 RepID=A0A8H6I8C4_9AGAR|nr:hypothetical protein DFP72DRAFT_843025 [Tulosesus angulatus]